MGAGLISGGTAAAMTAIDGGSTKDIIRSAAIGFATGAVINKLFSSGMCFVEGTAVLTEDGALAIEAVAVGMLVYAYDGATGDVALKPVVQLFRNETDELTTVRASDGQEIVSTPTHPYYTINRGWLAAKDLRAGDILLLVNGKNVVVEYIQHEILESPVKVYNFEVADYHTYYVAESVTASIDSFVLVHNSCKHQTPEWKSTRQNFWKSEAKGPNAAMYDAISEGNTGRMAKGLAPIGEDGYSMVLHHNQGIKVDFYDFSPMTRTHHQLQHLYMRLFG